MGKRRMPVRRAVIVLSALVLLMVQAMPKDGKDKIVPEPLTEALQLKAGSGSGISELGGPKCADAPSNETALLLQIFLGTLGTAFGYVGQWGLFCGAFIPFIFFCCFSVGMKANLESQGGGYERTPDNPISESEIKGNPMLALGSCLTRLCTFWIFGFWIWGIVQFADHEILAGDGCVLK